MYRLIFQNSKIALTFVVMTIFSAAAMVGTPEDSGLVARVAALAKASGGYRSADAANPSVPRPASPSIFGDYNAAGDEAPVAGETLEPEPIK